MAASLSGVRIGAEELDQRAMVAEFFERFSHFCVIAMAGEIDVEDVFPVLSLGRAGLDFAQRCEDKCGVRRNEVRQTRAAAKVSLGRAVIVLSRLKQGD